MDTNESLAEVKRLLGLVPMVDVVWEQKVPAYIRLGLAVQSPESLAQLAHIATAANVLLEVEVDWGWQGGKDDPACLRFDLRVPFDAEPRDPPSTLEIVGIYLVRYLKERGLLAPGEADRLLRSWNSG